MIVDGSLLSNTLSLIHQISVHCFVFDIHCLENVTVRADLILLLNESLDICIGLCSRAEYPLNRGWLGTFLSVDLAVSKHVGSLGFRFVWLYIWSLVSDNIINVSV